MENNIESRDDVRSKLEQKSIKSRRISRKRSYTTVNVPWTLMNRIDFVLKEGDHGYASRTDFIYDSIRRRLRELDYLK